MLIDISKKNLKNLPLSNTELNFMHSLLKQNITNSSSLVTIKDTLYQIDKLSLRFPSILDYFMEDFFQIITKQNNIVIFFFIIFYYF